jgi:Na+-translocating ferredoxin:NAD+ oxidoreductase RnfC subunit
MKLEELKEKIKSAGVIGAGGAGFPTHMKLAEGIDTILVNAAECEPLLYTDFTIMQQHMEMVVCGAEAFREALGAKQTIVAMKIHTAEALGFLDGVKLGGLVSVKVLPDAYPMGDEIIMIYQALGRIVPPGQLPSSAGVVVINVETAYNICNSMQNIPVTEKWITIGGNIKNPVVVKVPINCSVKNVLKAAGVSIPPEHTVLDGGPAMGNIINVNVAKITKKTKSLLILPNDIPAIAFKSASVERVLKRTSSACCQCFYCTDMCPRHLIGYPLEPHKTLRAAGSGKIQNPDDLVTASLCSGCGVCTLMACCQGIIPSAVMLEVKKNLGKNRMGYRSSEPTVPNAERDDRLVPVSRLRSRMGVAEFDKQASFEGDLPIQQKTFSLMLLQHVGKPAIPVVSQGDTVSAGQMIARADDGISAALHTPVSGRVAMIDGFQIEIIADEGK